MGLMLYEMVSGRKAIAAANVFEAFELVGKIEPAAYVTQTAQPFAGILARANP